MKAELQTKKNILSADSLPKMPMTAAIESGQSQKPATSPGCCTWVQGPSTLPASAAFSGALTWS